MKTWLELRYGDPEEHGKTVARIYTPGLIASAKERILADEAERVRACEAVDVLAGKLKLGDYIKLKLLLDSLAPLVTKEGQQ